MAESQPVDGAAQAPQLVFGVYPGGLTGTESESLVGTADDPERTEEALARLQPEGRPFLVRGYVHYTGAGRAENLTPAGMTQYVRGQRRLDLVLCFRSADGDLNDWSRFVRAAVREYGPHLGAVQVAEEPNNPGPGGDGGFAHVRQAVVTGVIAAQEEARRQGCAAPVGFNATPSFPPDNFWTDLAARGGRPFLDALDYVGLDFFPDVFRPIAAADLGGAVAGLLAHFRQVVLPAGGIPARVPIRVTENGWPTGPGRSPERQAATLETVIRTVHDRRAVLNIAGYELFDLRDADSSRPNLFCQFGLLRDDYEPKPAFETYRRLIAELGAEAWPGG
jgi:hypothetical protein